MTTAINNDLLRGRSTVARLTNKSGGAVAVGDVVILSSANAGAFTTTTSAAQTDDWVGVVIETIADNASGRVCLFGYVSQINLSASASLGDYVLTHSVAKQGVPSSSNSNGVFGQVLGTGTSPAAIIWGKPRYDLSFTEGAGIRIDTSVLMGLLGYPCNGRLTLTTGVPVTTSDVTAATTLYFTPFKGNHICIYDGSKWKAYAFTELSLSLSGYTADKNYDIFIYDNGGTLTLESVVWTDNTTRATALTTQDGVYVKSGTTTKRYLGTIRITGTTGQCESSLTKRFVWNYYNRVRRAFFKDEVTDHSYSTNAWRYVNNNSAHKVEIVIGVAEEAITLSINACVRCDGSGRWQLTGIGYDTTSVAITEKLQLEHSNWDAFARITATQEHMPTAGYHYYSMIELASGAQSTWLYVGMDGSITG